MRVLLAVGVVGFLVVAPTSAAEQTWVGEISDSMCGAQHAAAEHGRKMTDRDCVQECARKGAEYVLVSGGKVYKLRNHDADLAAQAGHTVSLSGELSGDTIRVSKIEASKASKS